jgi:UDP-glucose:(heptosyl)LPS alpha-1,3-glucosyltransferase
MEYERAVFGQESNTQILMISQTQLPLFQKHYGTPTERFHMLPPGVSRDRIAPDNATEIRQTFRKEFDVTPNDTLLLLLGSDFKRKGLDRVLRAMAALPQPQRERTKLFVVGRDNPKPFESLARALGLAVQLKIFLGRIDAPRFLLGADFLLHPAHHENTGTVILEALAAGLPVITTANCGYAHYVIHANAGVVLPDPFDQKGLNIAVENAISNSRELGQWRANALAFAKTADIYSLPQCAAEMIFSIGDYERPNDRAAILN